MDLSTSLLKLAGTAFPASLTRESLLTSFPSSFHLSHFCLVVLPDIIFLFFLLPYLLKVGMCTRAQSISQHVDDG